MGVAPARTADGKDRRRKVMVHLISSGPYAISSNEYYAKQFPKAVKYALMRFLRKRMQLTIAIFLKMPDGMWKLAVVSGFERVFLKRHNMRNLFKYRLFYKMVPECPETPNLNFAKLWLRINLDWLLFTQIYKPQLHRIGLII